MRVSARTLLAAGALLAAGLAIPAAASAAPRAHHHGHGDHRPSGVVFVADDGLGGNAIHAFDRSPDGTLVAAGTYPTGGLGGRLDGSVVDHLASQGAVATDASRSQLFAVNAGSDTLSAFTIRGDRLDRRQLVPTDGSFPVSIAVHGPWVWVLNARAGGSLQGYLDVFGRLLPIPAWHRELGLPTSGAEFTHTPGQVAFTPDGRHLVVTTKAASDSILVYAVSRFGFPAGQPTVRTEPGTVPFSVALDRFGRLAVSHAGTSEVTSYALAGDGTLTPLGSTATGQPATCWVTAAGRYLVASNTGGASLTSVLTTAAGASSAVATAATDGGPVDSAYAADGSDLYVQAGAAGAIDEFALAADGSLTALGSVSVPGATGGEGIVAW